MDFAITEGSTPEYQVTLLDGDNTPVGDAALSAARLTFYSVRSGAIINDRWNQNVLNAHDVTISSEGEVRWKLAEVDTILQGTPKPATGHYCAKLVFEWLDAESIPRQFASELHFYISRATYAPFSATP